MGTSSISKRKLQIKAMAHCSVLLWKFVDQILSLCADLVLSELNLIYTSQECSPSTLLDLQR